MFEWNPKLKKVKVHIKPADEKRIKAINAAGKEADVDDVQWADDILCVKTVAEGPLLELVEYALNHPHLGVGSYGII